MAHVELSLSEVFAPIARTVPEHLNLQRWADTVSAAAEPCLLIDIDTSITAISVAACTLLGLGSPQDMLGLPLLGGGLRLLDFTAARAELTEQEVDKIPPLLALSSGRLARGLLRVRPHTGSSLDATVDAISTPVLLHGTVAGSLTFFSEV